MSVSRPRRVMVLGSGPIVIGQASEFDYAGTQACRKLQELGIPSVLVNSNPATIMTDLEMATKVYLEPLDRHIIERIMLDEEVDGLLASLGGQTALNLAMDMAEDGFLAEHGIEILGTSIEGIKRGEDREEFRSLCLDHDINIVPSKTAGSIEEILTIVEDMGYPIILRPAYTLGGSGGGIAHNEAELLQIAKRGLELSHNHQVLVEKSIAGWQEIEFELVRDATGQKMVVCSMENFDPVGIHTGDSIVYAPAQTLTSEQEELLATKALELVEALEIIGACNCQFALKPETLEYAVIEVNPRLSRSSALASKATAYPIAKVATQLALGFSLHEIQNPFDPEISALHPPELNYTVAKIPKWPFEKFREARRRLGTQMQATGEVMALGKDRAEALAKALRSLEQTRDSLYQPDLAAMSDEKVYEGLARVDDERVFFLGELVRRGVSIEALRDLTGIQAAFLEDLKLILETELESRPLKPGYLVVDSLAGKSTGDPRYLYSTTAPDARSVPLPEKSKPRVVILGSGPIRIGQGIEFDYCSVHAVMAFRKMGWETILINNNPETVSTDFDLADRLYFEPITLRDLLPILEREEPDGVVCQFGGQTALKLIAEIEDAGYPILGTTSSGVDLAEDREEFETILERLKIPRPEARTAHSEAEAMRVAEELQFPLLLRPSYILGGRGMKICHDLSEVEEYLKGIPDEDRTKAILIDHYLMGQEFEIDAVSDGENILIPGITEHLERAGVHSGDSISIFPARLTYNQTASILSQAEALAKEIGIIGLFNIQFILFEDEVYVLELNPRASRTVPYHTKVTGLPMVEIAVRTMLGETLESQGFRESLYLRKSSITAIKAPVFSFSKLIAVDPILGPEMKSTGEVLGLGKSYPEAMYKALLASGLEFPKTGSSVFLMVRDEDRRELVPLADRLYDLGLTIYGSSSLARYLNQHWVPTNTWSKDIDATSLQEADVQLIITTTNRPGDATTSDYHLRRIGLDQGITSLSSLDTLRGVVEGLESDLHAKELFLAPLDEFQTMLLSKRKEIINER